MYNLTNVTNANTPPEIIGAVNELSGGIMLILLLFLLWLLILIAFRKFTFKAVFLVDGFITTVLAVIFLAMEWATWDILIFPIIVFLASILTYMFMD